MSAMAGRTMVPPAAGGRLTLGAGKQPVSPSHHNLFRVTAVAERLAFHTRQGCQVDCIEFFNLCMSLAKGIDFAAANNERPQTANDLPSLLKQVCQQKNDVSFQAAVMVLMISVKSACKIGWFKEKDTEELFALADEVGRCSYNSEDITTHTSDHFSIIPTIMSRFYPQIQMGNMLASLVVKPGYGIYCIDFHVSESTPRGQIRLFVAQIDNIETSSCIISPQQVNFLLNGKGVEKRTCALMDPGPQIPTNITEMLICGTNLLQVVGQFNGHYIIAVAFMSTTTLKDAPCLSDYVQPSTASAVPDSDITEGASRISLNCPISFSRIRIPVKGSLCKHYQCFDFINFVDINTRRPSWRCPHCNQHLCYTDIRVDQSMVKVLRDVGESVTSVMISVDGSWRAVLEDDENAQKKLENPVDTRKRKGMSEQQESVTSSSAVPMVVDLTEADDLMDAVDITDIEDTNLLPPQITDGFWSSLLNSGSLDDLGLDMQMDSGNSDLNFPNTTTSPVLTDAVSPALNRAVDGGTNLQSATQLPNANGYGTLPHLHRNLGNIHRNPVAVQGLPAQGLAPQQRSRPISSTIVPQGYSSGASAVPGLNTNWNHHDFSYFPGLSTQQLSSSLASSNPSQVAYGPSTLRAESQNIHQQQSFRVPHPMTQSPGVGVGNTTGSLSSQQGRYLNTMQRPDTRNLGNIHRNPVVVQALPAQSLVPQRRSRPTSSTNVGVGNTTGSLSSQQGRHSNTAPGAVLAGRLLPTAPGQIHTSRPGASNLVSPNGIRTPAVYTRRNIGATSVTDSPLDSTAAQLPNANEYGMLLQLHRNLGNIHRNPVVVQALPAQSLVPQRRSRPTSSTNVGVGNTTGSLSSQQDRHSNTAPGAVLAGRLLPTAPGQIHTSRPGASNLVSPNGIRTPAVYTRRNIGATSVTDSPLDSSSEQNWRPTGRMRGSLQGQAYSEALRVFMPQHDQQAPAPRPTNSASPVTRPVELQAILSNMRNAPAPPVRDTQTPPAASFDGSNP